MSVVYKLGEGPINYEWNSRYITIKGKELTYSITANSEERRTINLEGAITSNVCRIKGNKYSFALVIPIFQVLFFSTNTYQEILSFREQIIQAASCSALRAKRAKSLISQDDYHMVSSLSLANPALPYSADFATKIETLRREVVFDEAKYSSHYIGAVRYSSPREITIDFWGVWIDIAVYLLKLLIPAIIAYFICLFLEYKVMISSILLMLSIWYTSLMKVSLFAYSSKQHCSYIVKASTIISCNKEKVISILKNDSLRSEWDDLVTKVHCSKDSELRVGFEIEPSMKSFFFSLLMRINQSLLIKKKAESLLVFERIEFKDKEGNEYFLFKSPDSKGPSLFNENPFEMFVVRGVKDVYEEKTLVVFLTNNDWRHHDMGYVMRQYMKEQRLDVVNCLREYLMAENVAGSIESFL